KVLHRVLYDVHLGRPPTRDVSHGMHCLDHLRKDTMCNADDYLLSTPPGVYGRDGPRGQARQCRDWDAFVDWSKGFSSCYRHITDDEVYYHKHYRAIDRYSICPENSPYFQKAQAYLKTHRGGSVAVEQKRSDSPGAEEVWPAL
ncbi:MAG: hypothetical protein M1830_005898, partial [Pleopsidium flavum]